MEKTEARGTVKESIERARKPGKAEREESFAERCRNFANAKREFLFLGTATAKEIKEGGLIDDLVGREGSPEIISERVTDSKFGEIRGDFVGERAIAFSDDGFDEKWTRGTDGANGRKVIATKKAIIGVFSFESEMKQRSDVGPKR